MLNSLVIKNFRMLEDFKIEKLGRVNLIVGKNNSGKSTVLEALRIYAGNANEELLKTITESHDEIFSSDCKIFFPNNGLCCTNQICSKPPQPQNSFML